MLRMSTLLLCMLAVGAATPAFADPASQPASAPAAAPEQVAEPEPADTQDEPTRKPTVDWGYKGGFFVQTVDKKFKFKLGGWAWTTYTARFKDGDLSDHAVSLRTARLVIKATAFKHLHIKSVINLSAELPILDFHATYQPCDAFGVRFGQFKAPIVRHFLVVPWKRTFVSSALAMTKFKHDWDMGVNVLGSFRNHMIEYQAGVFSGAGKNKPNDNTDLMGAARVVFNPFGPVGLIESDYKGSPKPLLSVGLGMIYNPVTKTSTDSTGKTVSTDSTQAKMSADVAFFFKGLAVIAEVYYKSAWTEDKDAVNGIGWLAQAGYFLLPKRLEAAARGSMIRLDLDKDDADQYETSLVVNYYIYKTMFKVQAEYAMRLIKDPKKDDLYDHAIRLQALFRF